MSRRSAGITALVLYLLALGLLFFPVLTEVGACGPALVEVLAGAESGCRVDAARRVGWGLLALLASVPAAVAYVARSHEGDRAATRTWSFQVPDELAVREPDTAAGAAAPPDPDVADALREARDSAPRRPRRR